MTANHPYPASREAILPIFSKPAQQRRNLADAKSPELFVLLHGMLFTNIQLDDFQPTLARYLERLQLDGAQEREWIMMAVINIAAVLQYGKSDSVIRLAAGASDAPGSVAGKKGALELKMGSLAVSDSPLVPAASSSNMDIDAPEDSESLPTGVPISLQLTLQLAFTTLSFCLRHPQRRSSAFARPTLNPYITIFLTFLHTILKLPGVLPVIERSFPWDDLVAFLQTVPRRQLQKEIETNAKLTSGCAPLPEDWCLRGMAWAGRRVYEHGFWVRGATKGSNEVSGEMEVLLATENEEQDTDGIIEDDEHGEDAGPKDYTNRRWVRIIRSCIGLAQSVPGFDLRRQEGSSVNWELGEAMRLKAEMWREEERMEREEEERRRNRHWGDDDDDMDLDVEEEEDEEFDDDPEVRALQVRGFCLFVQRPSLKPSSCRSDANTYEVCKMERRHVAVQPNVDLREHMLLLLVRSFLFAPAIPCLWSIPIFSYLLSHLSFLSSKVTDGPFSSLWLSSRSWTAYLPASLSWEKRLLMPPSMLRPTSASTRSPSKSKPRAEITYLPSTFVAKASTSHPMTKEMARAPMAVIGNGAWMT